MSKCGGLLWRMKGRRKSFVETGAGGPERQGLTKQSRLLAQNQCPAQHNSPPLVRP